MPKTLTKHGNSYALVIDKPILDLLKITPDTLLELSTNGTRLIISPIRDEEDERLLQETLAEIDDKFGPLLKKLAE